MNSIEALVKRLQTTHTTLIMGAGISYESANIPLGVELAWKFAEDMNLKNSPLLKKSIRKIQHDYPHFQINDFKTIAFALSEIDREKLTKVSIPYFITQNNSPIHKTIANITKNNGINSIINYNFDEILENYLQIPRITTNEDYKDISSENPVHIKIHGTYSMPKNMRFLRTDWYRFENKVKQATVKRLQLTQTLLVAGFRLNFKPFVELIKTNIRPDCEIYVINKQNHEVHPSLEKSITQFFDINETSSTQLFQEIEKKIHSNKMNNCTIKSRYT